MRVGLVVVLVVSVGLAAWPFRPTPTRGRPVRTGPGSGAGIHRVGLVALLVAVAVALSPMVALLLVVGLRLRPRLVARRRQRAERWAVLDGLPEAVDLLALAVAGGSTVSMAVASAARWAPDPLGPAFADAVRAVELGQPTTEALEAVADRLGDPSRPLVAALLASERYGVPLADALDRLAREARLDRRRRAEERARRVPVLLLFPLVLCVLPAFGLLTVVPLLVGSLPQLPG